MPSRKQLDKICVYLLERLLVESFFEEYLDSPRCLNESR